HLRFTEPGDGVGTVENRKAHAPHHATRSPAGGPVRVARPPGFPGDVPVAEAVVAGQHPSDGVAHLDRVTAFDHVLEPCGGFGGDVDAAVRDVSAALVAHRPRRGVDVDAGPGH